MKKLTAYLSLVAVCFTFNPATSEAALFNWLSRQLVTIGGYVAGAGSAVGGFFVGGFQRLFGEHGWIVDTDERWTPERDENSPTLGGVYRGSRDFFNGSRFRGKKSGVEHPKDYAETAELTPEEQAALEKELLEGVEASETTEITERGIEVSQAEKLSDEELAGLVDSVDTDDISTEDKVAASDSANKATEK